MARPRKNGLFYFPLDTDLFQDTKIRVVRARYGGNGIMLYIYLLCEIYPKGYFCRADEDMRYCAAADLSIPMEQITEMLEFFCEKRLFDSEIYHRHGILTSRAVQLRFQEAGKGFRREIPVNGELWLLSPEETLPIIIFGTQGME